MDKTLIEQARIALACLDLTSLNDGDTEADIQRLCQRAIGSDPARGPVAAVCVWPRLAAFARAQLPPHIAVAAVANFPAGSGNVQQALNDTQQIVQAGANEVDVVLPYRSLAQGAAGVVVAGTLLQAVRRACEGLKLKVIIETGALNDDAIIQQGCRMALDAGADFLKTSTGKTPISATPHAATLLLQAISTDPRARSRVGFKPSGGIRTVAEAGAYLALTAEHLGQEALMPARFRIGASSLLNDIERVLSGGAAVSTPQPQGY